MKSALVKNLWVNPVLCIAGPTASGKSAFAAQLAQRHDGEIINADALQVYSDLQVMSARPSAAEMGDISHHLFGHVDASERYNTGRWLREVTPVIIDVLARGKMPIITGGTGLYFKALTEGLAQVPVPSDAGKAEAKTLFEQGIDVLADRAKILDPTAFARVLGKDPQRLLRIVEVALGTEKPLSVWQAQTYPIIPKREWRGLILLPDRAALYERINARFDSMAESGGYDEAAKLAERNLDPMLPAMKAIGVRELMGINNGALDADEGIETAKRETRRFAKRQYTWFRGQAASWPVAITQSDRDDFGKSLRKIMI